MAKTKSGKTGKSSKTVKTQSAKPALGVPVFRNPEFVEAYRQYLIHETEWFVRDNIIEAFQTVNLDLIPYPLKTLDDILRFQHDVLDLLLDGEEPMEMYTFFQTASPETQEEYRRLDKILHRAGTAP